MTDPLGFGELLHGLLEVAERPLNKALVLLEVVEQHIPQWLFRQHLGVTQYDYAILGPGQGYIEPPRVTEETNSLHKVCIHRSVDGNRGMYTKTGKQDIANRQQTEESMQGLTA